MATETCAMVNLTSPAPWSLLSWLSGLQRLMLGIYITYVDTTEIGGRIPPASFQYLPCQELSGETFLSLPEVV